MTLPMALVDFVPVVFFLLAAVRLQRDLYNKMSKGAFALFAAGTIVVFTAGLFKATWKLLYALGLCDYVMLNQAFFPMQTTGFVLAAAGIGALLTHRQGRGAVYAAAPVVYESKMIFVAMMVLGVTMLDGGLIAVAAKRRSRTAAALFALSLVLTLGMGYLATKDFDQPSMNWIAEGVNVAGEGCFLLAAQLLHKGGLEAPDALG